MNPNPSDIYAGFGNDHVARDLFIHLCLRACPVDGVTVTVGKKTVALNKGDILFSATQFAKILRLGSRQAALNALTRLEVKYGILDSNMDSIVDSKVDSILDSKRPTNLTVVSLKQGMRNFGLDSIVDSKVDSILDSTVDSKKRNKEYNARIVSNNKYNNNTKLLITNKSLPDKNFSFPPELTEEEQEMFTGWLEDLKKAKKPKTAYGTALAVKRYAAISPVPALRLAFLRNAREKPWEKFYTPDLTPAIYWKAVAGLTPDQRRDGAGVQLREWLKENLPDEYQNLFP